MIDFQSYIGRIKQTSPGEVAYRARRLLLAQTLKHAALKQKPMIAVPRWEQEKVHQLQLPRFDFTPQVNTNRNGQPPKGGTPSTLNTDPASIRAFENACQNLFFTSVGRRCGGIDIRSVWEPARLQHLVRSFLLGEPPEIHAAQAEVLQWIADNPFLQGPHYLSPMECGLRVPVFFYCLKSMADASQQDADIIAEAIYRHAWWIYRNLSLHNSLGNHTVCECLGLIFAGAVFGHTREGEKWLTRGCHLLDQEICHQILPDGGPAEQSTAYARFVLDLYWLAFHFLRGNGLHDCQRWRKRLEGGETFLAAFAIDKNRYIPFGDSDDGHAVAPGLHPHRAAPQQPAERIQHFDASGYTVVRDGDLLMTFDHGPLGMAPLYNHGHADALSLTLRINGLPFLIDPGTYCYNSDLEFRRYFKGTSAHNTITIDGMDQAIQASSFIWRKPFSCGLSFFQDDKDALILRALHNGYMRLKRPVLHLRTVVWDRQSTILLLDTFEGKGSHDYSLHFHLHPQAISRRHRSHWIVENQGVQLRIHFLGPYQVKEHMGELDPLLGWFSPGYGVKEPCQVLVARQNGDPNQVVFKTLLTWQGIH